MEEYKKELIEYISDYCTISKVLERNEFVYNLGSFNDTLYFVKKGTIKVCHALEDREIILTFGLPDEIVANLMTVITGEKSDLYLQAIKKTELIGIPKQEFNKLILQNNRLAMLCIRAAEQRIVESINMQILLSIHSPKAKVEGLLKVQPKLFQQVPHKYIAYYLGIAPETLSRILKS